MSFDYRKILKAYIWHIGECEGCTFLGRSAEPSIEGLTTEERDELRKIDKELEDEYHIRTTTTGIL
jgi:Fe-S cluster biogenesis protein NfuA